MYHALEQWPPNYDRLLVATSTAKPKNCTLENASLDEAGREGAEDEVGAEKGV